MRSIFSLIYCTSDTVLLSVSFSQMMSCCCCLKKNLNAPRPSEHPPVWGKKMLFLAFSVLVANPKNYFRLWPILFGEGDQSPDSLGEKGTAEPVSS